MFLQYNKPIKSNREGEWLTKKKYNYENTDLIRKEGSKNVIKTGWGACKAILGLCTKV